MPSVDLTGFMPEPLTITLGTSTYEVPPPSALDGLTLTALFTAQSVLALTSGLPDNERQQLVAELPAKVVDTLREHADDDLADLALSHALHQRMISDGQPAGAIDAAAIYATTFWVTGSKTAADEQAQAIMDARRGEHAETRIEENSSPKGSSLLPTGPHTGSENQQKTGGTLTTELHQPTSDRSHRASRNNRKKRRRK